MMRGKHGGEGAGRAEYRPGVGDGEGVESIREVGERHIM